MKKVIFRKLLLAMGITLGACLLLYPLLLPTENYFRLVLQIFPVAVFIGLVLLIPLNMLSDKISRSIAAELKNLKLDSSKTLNVVPELRPVARQIASIRAQMEAQRNELEGQQEQLRVLTDNMQEGLLLVSAAGRVLSSNRAALQLLGKEEASGEIRVFDLNDSKVFQDIVNHALDGVRGTAVITVNGTACQLIANPVTRGSMMTGAVLVLLDVTEREKRDALRREFTSNVSHELKTPLTSIYGIADMMGSGMVKEADIGGFARRIRDESARMITLIEDIIRLSRLDDDSFTEEILPIDLYQIAKNVREQLLPQAEKHHISLTLEGSRAPLQGVPVIVEEMLYNLCDNAIKYNNEGGSVHIKVTCADGSAVFTVTDTGIGIPQADKERIFERFYRVDKSRSKEIGGTGLGLSIVKHGAAFHNATIELESQLGSGTTITLFFPRSAESAAIAERDAKRNPLDVEVPGAAKGGRLIQVRGSRQPAKPAPKSPAKPAAKQPVRTPQKPAAPQKPATPANPAKTNPAAPVKPAAAVPKVQKAPVAAEKPVMTEHVMTEPVMTENVKTESIKTEPVKTEPTKPTAQPAEKPAPAPKQPAAAPAKAPIRPAAKPSRRGQSAPRGKAAGDGKPGFGLDWLINEAAAEAKRPAAKTILDANTEALSAELERSLAETEPEPVVQPEPIRIPEEQPEPVPEMVSAAEELRKHPDIVPISEETMDIQI